MTSVPISNSNGIKVAGWWGGKRAIQCSTIQKPKKKKSKRKRQQKQNIISALEKTKINKGKRKKQGEMRKKYCRGVGNYVFI
jgi:hypothetical protein